MKKMLVVLIILVIAAGFIGCNSGQEQEKKVEKTYDKAPTMKIDTSKTYTAKMETSSGIIEIKLFAKEAPKTVNNFVYLSKEGYYDGTIFHRVIKDFMIQGGDPKGTGTGGPGYEFEDEINKIKLTQGKLAMANRGKNTNGSQFFIVTAKETPWLDGKHTVFGEVTKGLDVVLKIGKEEVGLGDKPVVDATIEKITISD